MAATPNTPCSWMLETRGLVVKSPWRSSAVLIPDMRHIIQAYDTKNTKTSTIVKVPRDAVCCWAMRIERASPVQRALAQQLARHFREKNVHKLRECWISFGVVAKTADGSDGEDSGSDSSSASSSSPAPPCQQPPAKVAMAKLWEFWGEHCIVVVDRIGRALCTCWYSARRGHCPHECDGHRRDRLACAFVREVGPGWGERRPPGC